MPNQIFVIAPYSSDDTWVFDDEARSLSREPFVSGADTFVTRLSRDIPDADRGFQLLFSAGPLPGFQAKVVRVRSENGWRLVSRWRSSARWPPKCIRSHRPNAIPALHRVKFCRLVSSN